MLKKGQLVLISVKCLQAIINNTFDKHAIDTFATHIFQADKLSIPGSSAESFWINGDCALAVRAREKLLT